MDDTEVVKFRVSAELKQAFDAVLGGKNLTLQDAGEGLVRFFVEDADDLLRSMLGGQVERREDLARLVLKRLMAKKKAKPFKPDQLRGGSSLQRPQKAPSGASGESAHAKQG